MSDYVLQSKNPQQIEVLIQTMDEEIIFVPKTRITDELKVRIILSFKKSNEKAC